MYVKSKRATIKSIAGAVQLGHLSGLPDVLREFVLEARKGRCNPSEREAWAAEFILFCNHNGIRAEIKEKFSYLSVDIRDRTPPNIQNLAWLLEFCSDMGRMFLIEKRLEWLQVEMRRQGLFIYSKEVFGTLCIELDSNTPDDLRRLARQLEAQWRQAK